MVKSILSVHQTLRRFGASTGSATDAQRPMLSDRKLSDRKLNDRKQGAKLKRKFQKMALSVKKPV
jgi:hypothetical protein